ncbi:RtcB family protein [Paenibacillus shunpengii]|uniref:3'-phosphate/5'-hydroxy nucleic acid ligase n=1 Tax=Paenibacillus shunpengii TaxID=2054424 RepID=A0ABW5SIR2_9BACL|nr:RtcB family protein [Paenibacillus sp. PDC88]SDW34715.1 RNA-splicing ligase RtcB, repairs tRNA damage [Paenibacillus sp. PDC88]
MIEAIGKYNTAKIFTDTIDETAYAQVLELCNQKAFEGVQIRIMPDTHAGKGCVIGFTAELAGRVVPNLIGVDIGCGMEVTYLGPIDINFEELNHFIRHKVPHGHSIHQKIVHPIHKPVLEQKIENIASKTGTVYEKHLRSVGSLGGGNHFIEINEDSSGNKILVIHSGSRNLGLQVAKYHQKKAELYCTDRIKDLTYQQNEEIGLLKKSGNLDAIPAVMEKYKALMEVYQVPKPLMYLEGAGADEYLADMYAAQEFALLNRQGMSRAIAEFLNLNYRQLEKFTTIHNYINPEDKIIRKGAISAKAGEKVIIPINMRDGSIIAIGKGNPDWNHSAPHGAGRLMSRSRAKDILHMNDFKDTMRGVWTSSVSTATLDEAPMAYKPIEEILENTVDALEIVEIIKPLYNFKASN